MGIELFKYGRSIEYANNLNGTTSLVLIAGKQLAEYIYLIAKLADLEWEDFEVKAAKGRLPKDTWETVSAFSNTSRGWLLFGIIQNGKQFEVQGLNNPEKVEQDFF